MLQEEAQVNAADSAANEVNTADPAAWAEVEKPTFEVKAVNPASGVNEVESANAAQKIKAATPAVFVSCT